MNIKEQFNILSKLNIIKGYLIDENSNYNEFLKVYISLLNDSMDDLNSSIKLGNYKNALNIVNKNIISISKVIYSNPCNQKWDDLLSIGEDDKKYCSECGKYVYLVSDNEVFEKRKKIRQCIAYRESELHNINIEGFQSCRIIIDDTLILDKPIKLKTYE